MGHPQYKKARRLDPSEFQKMSQREKILSYTIIKGTFKFPENVKYPSIPCFLDETTTVYPLEGECFLTGAEYVLAEEQGCEIEFQEIYYIPFQTTGVKEEHLANLNDKIVINYNDGDYDYGFLINQPFFEVIKNLQSKRAKYPPKTINNLLYKELGNSIYGLIAKGISNKMKFDVRLGKTVRMEGNDLSNPIIAS